ncbi:MAG: beta-ketoacyl-[acyl-carrier-protein] synthase family protein [Bacteroidales bacterium]|jgi:3-oxoacyl-[acyl-carrier-protein] synthase-1|nr:beta-ketoacyl-[acyl-carrier-protein] synthase family protein [Bacteroidales bacterium]
MSQRRVVITGLGIYSTLGKNLNEVTESLYRGKSGIGFDPLRKQFGYQSGLTGILERPVLKGLLDRRSRAGLSEQGEYAYIATLEAMDLAKLDADYCENHELGILYGNDSSIEPVIRSTDIIREKGDTVMGGSGAIFQSLNSTVSMNLSVIFKVKGINLTISGACASGSHAIGLGSLLIKWGLQDCIICGGAQEVNVYSVSTFDALSAFSKREDEPQKASRPFDINRDGLVPSGGAATVIIESYESAVKRGAPIIAEVIGYGFSSNGDHLSVPNVSGPTRSLKMSLREAGVATSDIGYVNAHATSTLIGDRNEAKAIADVFGDHTAWVASTKAMTGHEMWMAGASEIVYSTLMMQNNFIAPNINLETPDEESARLKIPTKTIETSFDMFLSNSFGFGGTNSSLIIKKFQG